MAHWTNRSAAILSTCSLEFTLLRLAFTVKSTLSWRFYYTSSSC